MRRVCSGLIQSDSPGPENYVAFACSSQKCQVCASHRNTTNDGQNFSSNVARTRWSREKNERWRNFVWLRRALHWCVRPKLVDGFGRFIRGVKRCPHWAWCDHIHTYPSVNKVRGQRPGKSMDAPLGHRVVQQVLVAEQSGDRAGHHDRAAFLHHRHRGLRHMEVAVQVCLDGSIEVLFREVFEFVDVLLKCGIVDQDVEPTERLKRLFYSGTAKGGACDVS